MSYFRLPLIVTGVGFGAVILLGIIGMAVILGGSAPDRDKQTRAGLLGSGLATVFCLGVAPFWIFAAAKLGKDRREAQNQLKKVGSAKKRKKPQE